MTTLEEKPSLGTFVYQIIDYINSDRTIHQKLMDSLTYICSHFQYKRGFVYQTDGFRYFHLSESIGNEDDLLRPKFELGDLSQAHLDLVKSNECRFYASKSRLPSAIELDIIEFYHVDSLLARPVRDTEGKTIGFIGVADSLHEIGHSDEEFKSLFIAMDLLGKEMAMREYLEREIRSRQTLESIMNNMGVDIYVNAFDTHEMLYANTSMAAPYGGVQNFTEKKCWEALFPDRVGECDFCPKYKLIDEYGKPTKVYSWDYQRQFDGSWFRVFSAAFNWIDGQLAHVITSVDITNQKNIEGELLVARDKAENLDRLKSAFLANMSHEIRTPLNAIVGFSDLLAVTDDPDDRHDYVQVIQQNNELLLQLITDILDLSKLESGMLDYEIKRLNVKELCEEIVHSYQVKETNNVVIRFETETEGYCILSDKKRLTQVITNFINNALKFTSKGEIVLGYNLKDSGQIEIYVQDTGIGIPPEKIDDVFGRFVKLNTFAQGTGLGLSICKSIIEHLGGTIGVQSTVGVGSRFWFTHPSDASAKAE